MKTINKEVRYNSDMGHFDGLKFGNVYTAIGDNGTQYIIEDNVYGERSTISKDKFIEVEDNLKVFQMDEMSWVAAETAGRALDYYMQESCDDLETALEEMEECNINEPNSMWWNIDEFPKKYPSGSDVDMTNFNPGDEMQINGVTFGYWDGSPAKMISYREAHKLYGEKLPYFIATCL